MLSHTISFWGIQGRWYMNLAPGCFFNIISYCFPPLCFLLQLLLFLKPLSPFLPVGIYICCFFYLECISPAFHMEGSFSSLVSVLLLPLQRGLLWTTVCRVLLSFNTTFYHITPLIVSKAHRYGYLVCMFVYLFIVCLPHYTVNSTRKELVCLLYHCISSK